MVVDVFGRLDVVVNNAGYGDIAPFEQLSSEKFKRTRPVMTLSRCSGRVVKVLEAEVGIGRPPPQSWQNAKTSRWGLAYCEKLLASG
jgi:NAD(P)-dependent dehydrogenase (short-subunit alcohol dehydrogenase family)